MGLMAVADAIPAPEGWRKVNTLTSNLSPKSVMVDSVEVTEGHTRNHRTLEVGVILVAQGQDLAKGYASLREGFDQFEQLLIDGREFVILNTFGPYQLDQFIAMDVTVRTIK